MSVFGARAVILVAVALLAAGCRGGSDRASAPAETAAPRAASPAAAETARVLRVVDGDTILVEIDGRQERVRYIGVDTPETVAQDRPVECFGPEASAANKDLVEGKTVRLERDISERDQFGRLLRYVYAGDVFVNAELIRRGYATTVTFPPDVRETERLRRLERDARQARRGLWGKCR